MASRPLNPKPKPSLLLFLSCLLLGLKSLHGVVLPVRKDPLTRQYVAEIRRGEPLVVDLGGSFLWRDCSFGSSRRPIRSVSPDCAKARAHQSRPGTGSRSYDATCDVLVQNGAAALTGVGELAEAGVGIKSPEVGEIDSLETLLFACAPSFLLHGLSSGTRGVLGLGKAQISFASQLVARLDHRRRRFALCLSSSTGVVTTGAVDSVFGAEISKSLAHTPLIANPRGDYVIRVKSIEIGGEKLPIGEPLLAELSTMAPYTTMETSIYEKFIEAYSNSIRSMSRFKIVDPTAPFGLCFMAKEYGGGALGVEPPVLDLVLQSEMVRWRIGGKNTVVDFAGGVKCLGVLDGGSGRENPIVLGGLQLEDRVLEFDLGGSVLGFGSLVTWQTSCSDLLSTRDSM